MKEPPTDLVVLWHFDEGVGTTASDSSGNGNNGTLKPTGSEPTWVMVVSWVMLSVLMAQMTMWIVTIMLVTSIH